MFIPQFALLNGHDGILLEWSRSLTPDFSHYEIQMSYTSGSGFQTLAETTEPRYIIPHVEPGVRYYFLVYAWDKSGNRSLPSREIEIAIP